MNATPTSPPTPDFRALFEALPGLYLILAPDFTIVAVSDAYLRATMTRRDEIMGRGIFEVFPDNPDDPAATGVRNLRASLQRVLQYKVADTMPVQKYDIRKPESEGGAFEERYWSPVNSPVLGKDNEVAYIVHRVEDVTDFMHLRQQELQQKELTEEFRAQAEQMQTEVLLRAREVQERTAALRQFELRFHTLVDAVKDYAIYMVDPQGRVSTWNAGAERIKGYRPEEIIGQHYSKFFTQEDLEHGKPSSGLKIAAAQGRFEDEGWRVRKDGSRFWASVVITAIRDQDGKLEGFAKVTRDLTDRRNVEAALQHNERQLRALFEFSPDAIVTTDREGRIIQVNAQVENMFGYDRSEVIGQPVESSSPRAVPARASRPSQGLYPPRASPPHGRRDWNSMASARMAANSPSTLRSGRSRRRKARS